MPADALQTQAPAAPAAPASPGSSVSSADVANATAINQAVSQVRQQLSANSTAIITKINAIATAITGKLIGGVVGTSANRLLRVKTVSSGAISGSVQNSPIACDDSGNLSGVANVTLVNGSAIQTDTTAAHTWLLQAYNTNTATYVTFGTLTANNPPTFDLAAGVTKGGIGLAILNTNTWLQQQGFGTVTLTDAATITWNAQTQQVAKVTLGGNRTLGAPSNLVDGFTYILRVIQDGSGSRTLAYNAVFKWPSGVAPVLSTGVAAIDVLTFVSDGTNMYGVAQKNFS